MENKPQTAKEIIESLPERLLRERIEESETTIFHFHIDGENGGEFTVKIENYICTVQDGFDGSADCTIKTVDKVYEDIELGRTNPQMAFFMGKIKIDNIGMMMKFVNYFQRLH